MSGSLTSVATVARGVNQGFGAVIDGVQTVQSLFTVGDGIGALGVSLDFYDLLQPASWRGLSFVVLGSHVRAGRRKALHEYPFRDGVWVEDMGKRGRVYGFEAFVIGDDVADQVKALIGAAEQVGPGELVHPTFGATQCELIEFEAGEQWDAGRVWRFRAEFLEPVARGLQLQPLAVANTPAAVATAAGDAQAATSNSFLVQIKSGLGAGIQGVKQAVAVVTPYVATATRLIADAGRLAGAVRTLSGNFGRYASGRTTTSSTSVLRTARQVEIAVQGALSATALARNSVTRAGNSLSALVDL